MRVRLVRKLANVINGLDVRPFATGSLIDLDDQVGDMLIREGWATRADRDAIASADDNPSTHRPRRRRKDSQS